MKELKEKYEKELQFLERIIAYSGKAASFQTTAIRAYVEALEKDNRELQDEIERLKNEQ